MISRASCLRAVSRANDFFSLGGHSLKATLLVAKLRALANIELTVRVVFDAPTVAGLASHLQSAETRGAGRLAGAREGSYQEFEVVDLDVQRANMAIRRLSARHPTLRTVIHPDGSQQVLESVPAFALDVVDLRGRPAEEVCAASDAARDALLSGGKRLDRWPLVGVLVHRLDDGVYCLHTGVPLVLADRLSSITVLRELRHRVARGDRSENAGSVTLIHLVCDNVSVHHGKMVRAWLERHPRFKMHFTPVHCSWMNQVEQWFSILRRKRLAAPNFANLAALEQAVLTFVVEWNQLSHAFKWTKKSFEKVLAKVDAAIAKVAATAKVDAATAAAA